MSLWSRLQNVFRRERLRRDIDEELESHLLEAIEQWPRSQRGSRRIRPSASMARRESAMSS